MKKVVLFLSLFLIPCFIFAQETDVVEVTAEVVAEAEVQKSAEVTEPGESAESEEETSEAAEQIVIQESDAVIAEEVSGGEVSGGEEELSREEKIAVAEEAYEAAKVEYEKRIEEIKEFYLEKFRSAADKKETAEAEYNQQKEMLAEKDKLRLLEEQVYSARRSEEENGELMRSVSSYNFLMTEKGDVFAEKIGPEENMLAAEEIKGKIWDLREDVRLKSEAFNSQKDAETNAKIDEITNAPYVEGETDSLGEPTRTALQRRTNRCQEAKNAAELEKSEYLKQLKDEISHDEKLLFTELAAAYRTLEAGHYVTNSFSDDIIFRVGNFNAEKGYWKVTVESGIFGHIGIIDMDFELTYEEVTGKKFITADQMSEEEFAEFSKNVTLYDYLFRQNANVIYARVYFTMYRWRETNEYRFTPSKLEIVRAGETPKVIHKEARVQAKSFIYYGAPVHEVRDTDTIKKDAQRAAKIVEREQKKAGTFNPAYSYDGSSTKSLVQQKGRGAFVIHPVFALPSEGVEKTGLDILGADITFGLGKYAFIGGDFGIQIPFIQEQIMEFGLEGGVNYKFGKFVRPYVKGTANISTTYNGILKAGAGVDLIFGIFLVNVEYNYGWYFDYNSHLNPNVDKSVLLEDDSIPCSQKQKLSVGIGVAF